MTNSLSLSDLPEGLQDLVKSTHISLADKITFTTVSQFLILLRVSKCPIPPDVQVDIVKNLVESVALASKATVLEAIVKGMSEPEAKTMLVETLKLGRENSRHMLAYKDLINDYFPREPK